MTWQVPLVEIDVRDEDVEAVLDCLRSGWLTMGPVTEEFESAFAAYVGAKHAVAVSSGTAALHLACIAADVGPGDEVIVPDMSFVACAHAPRYAGGLPVLCDIAAVSDPNLSIEDVERRITPRTKAVIAVHLFGYPADVLALRRVCDERRIALIEDCAQAVGAIVDAAAGRAGTVGDLGCFSFFSKKQLAVGEGGMVVTDDARLAARIRSLRSHAMTSVTWERHRGYAEGYDVTETGFNYRMDEPRAALAHSRLQRLEVDIAQRRRVAHAYRRGLEGMDGVELPWDAEALEGGSHFAFPFLLRDREARDAVRACLHERGVQTTWYPAIHSLSEYGSGDGAGLAMAGEFADRHCMLPVFASLSDERAELVVNELRSCLEPN